MVCTVCTAAMTTTDPAWLKCSRQLPDDEDIDVIDWTSGTSRFAAQEPAAALILVAYLLPLQVLGTRTGRPCTLSAMFPPLLLSRDLNQSSLLVIYTPVKTDEPSKAILIYFYILYMFLMLLH